MISGADIWIVDDVQSNRSLFASIVETLGHVPTVFNDGESAIAAADDHVPDLVLLDVMMPGLDGFQSCRELRKRFAAEMVPIVMVTANPDREMYARGLEAGADDYLFQPIDLAAIRSRISAMLRLRVTYRELSMTRKMLAGRVEILRQEVANAEQLLHLNDRLHSVGMMVAGIAHELKNPLAAVRFNLDWVSDQLEGNDAPEKSEMIEAVETSLEATESLEALIRDLSTFARPDRDDNRTSDVSAVLDSALRVTRHTIMGHGVVERDIEPGLVANIRPRRLAQVVINLLINATQAIAKSGARGTISISATGAEDEVEIVISDSGVGLPLDAADIFEPFYTTDPGTGGTGLGLGICAQIVETAGGTIGTRPSVLDGATIFFRLPRAD